MTDRRTIFKEITCIGCGAKELRKGIALRCFACVTSKRVKHDAKYQKALRDKQRADSPDSRGRSPGRPREYALRDMSKFNCCICTRNLDIAEKGKKRGKAWQCKVCTEIAAREVAYRIAHPKKPQKWTAYREEAMLRWIEKHGG